MTSVPLTLSTQLIHHCVVDFFFKENVGQESFCPHLFKNPALVSF